MDNYRFFSNKLCEYYPCHNVKEINCLFCYCPLYLTDCDGNFKLLCKNGKTVKDCSSCLIPHQRNNYDYIIEKIAESLNIQG